jgi:hypothetical protein
MGNRLSVTDERRLLILEICQGSLDVAQHVYPLEQFKLRTEIYRYLIKNKITGAKFLSFCNDFRFSSLRYGNELRKRVLKERESSLHAIDLL